MLFRNRIQVRSDDVDKKLSGIDSGMLNANHEIKGGKVGLYAKSLKNVLWSSLNIDCNGKIVIYLSQISNCIFSRYYIFKKYN